MTTPQPASVNAKSSLPISLLPTGLAQISTHVHPAILLSAYYLRFSSLVEAPVPTLLNSLLPLALVQICYVIICLPATGSAKVVKKGGKKGEVASNVNKPVTAILALTLSLLATPLLAAIQILLGAPLTTHLIHTLLSSAHLSLLALFPLIYVHGTSAAKWHEIASAYAPLDEVFGAAVGCVVGAWLGAVPIPLDWDREWQKWPITIVTGAYMGYVVGKLVGGSLVKGKRIEFD